MHKMMIVNAPVTIVVILIAIIFPAEIFFNHPEGRNTVSVKKTYATPAGSTNSVSCSTGQLIICYLRPDNADWFVI